MWFANIGEKTGMGGAALIEVGSCLDQAERSVHGHADIVCIFVLLAIVFPPADGA
jgi:hypothetical protein